MAFPADIIVSCKVFQPSDGAAGASSGPVARLTDVNNFYFSVFTSGPGNQKFTIQKVVAGVTTIISTTADQGQFPTSGYTIAFTLNGTSLSSTLTATNMNLSISTTDASLTTGLPGLNWGGAVPADLDDWQAQDTDSRPAASDNFNRPDGPLGSNWTIISGNPQIVSQISHTIDRLTALANWGGPFSSPPVNNTKTFKLQC